MELCKSCNQVLPTKVETHTPAKNPKYMELLPVFTGDILREIEKLFNVVSTYSTFTSNFSKPVIGINFTTAEYKLVSRLFGATSKPAKRGKRSFYMEYTSQNDRPVARIVDPKDRYPKQLTTGFVEFTPLDIRQAIEYLQKTS